MIKQLFKIVWKRKKSNFMLIIEIFISFVVLFSVLVFILHNLNNYNKPLGFDYKNVWNINTKSIEEIMDEIFYDVEIEKNTPVVLEQIEQALRSFDQVKEVSLLRPYPYELVMDSDNIKYNSKEVEVRKCNAYLNLNKILNLEIIKGRWFDRTDKSSEIQPIVINSIICEQLFGKENPIEKIVTAREREYKIVGVAKHYRTGGEFTTENPFIFCFTDYDHPDVPGNFIIKVSPTASAKLEAEIIKKLQLVAKERSFQISRLEDSRKSGLRLDKAPIIAFSLIIGFLLIMVGLGLLGVLWLNVSKRTKEIGLRRAKGANKIHIYKQISGEILVITAIGILIGLLLVVQFPMLGIFGFVQTKIFITSIFISCFIICLISYICSLYPSYLASKISPAEALHME